MKKRLTELMTFIVISTFSAVMLLIAAALFSQGQTICGVIWFLFWLRIYIGALKAQWRDIVQTIQEYSSKQ